ncbi:MAG: G5 domain-containing protein [Candidatus Limnocylindria bacterium]|nr:G5 domain-containing protein [Candidatus Limnocylindria bacterium]
MAGTAAYGFVLPALAAVHLDEPVALVALAEGGRVQSVSRGGVARGGTPTVTLEVDGLRAGSLQASGTVGDALAAFGIAPGAADRLSLPPETVLTPGMRISLGRGFPVTLIDGGRATEARSQRTTVGGFLAALAVGLNGDDSVADPREGVLGPGEVVKADPLDRILGPGDVVKIVRVADREVAEIASYPFRTRYVDDPALDLGRQVVEVSGVPGEVSETYLVRFTDGVESDRTLLSTVVLRSPVTEVRLVGSRPVPPPPAPLEIERIIRTAAARWSVDPEQLMRVAYCESRYDPYAFNPRASDSGLFQFIPRTWAANSVRAGYGGASPFDAVANANTAAFMFGQDQAWQWTCK